jgi:hypothetical protein
VKLQTTNAVSRIAAAFAREKYNIGALSRVVAGLVPATPIIDALCLHIRGRRDEPGDDAGYK